MSSRYSEDSRIVRCYSVTDPTLHHRGYTVYKVVEKKLDVEAFDEAVQESVSWKRYNEFYKLYLSLSSLHASLHRREVFPDFPKPQIFHRFDAEVIKDRMQSAQDLLNFIGQRKYLVESRAFKEFFQDLEVINPLEDASILQPIKANYKEEKIYKSSSDFDNFNVGSRPSEEIERGDYEEEEEEEDEDDYEDGSSYTDYDDEYDDYDNYEDYNNEMFGSNYDSFSSRVDPQEETRSLDSLIVEHCMTRSMQVDVTGVDLRTEEVELGRVGGFLEEPRGGACGDPMHENVADAESEEDLTFEFSKKDGGSIKRGFLRKTFFPVQAIWKTGKNLKHLLSASFHGSLPSPTKAESRQVKRQKLLQMLSTRAYIVEAAQSIKEAKVKENSGRYGDAFDLYKSAIGTMLKGVQSDTNTECIEFVRGKISRYLTKAEELYKLHLQCHEPYLFMPSNTNRFCRDISFLRGRAEDLEKFKVIGVLNKVMLVVDESSQQSDSYVMKVYPKTSSQTKNQTNIVPSCVPFMVGLVRFYETETAIYALLPHVSSGTLWNHVSAYVQQTDSTTPDVFEEARGEAQDEKKKGGGGRDPMEGPITFNLGLEDSDLFFEANDDFSTNGAIREKKDPDSLETSRVDHSGSSSFEAPSGTESDFQKILIKNTGQCLSMFSINSSEGDSTPTALHGQVPPTSERAPTNSGNEPSLLELFDPIVQRMDSSELPVGEEFLLEGQGCSTFVDDVQPQCDVKVKENDQKSLVKRLSLGLSSSCSEISRKNDRPRIRTSSSTFEELDLSGCCRVLQAPNNEELRRRRNLILLPEKFVRLWAAEMFVAICSLHECGIICRDLNPDNILIDPTGHVVLTYFCQWTTVEQRIKNSTIDNFYCAPELSSLSKVTRASDWWSFGVILFELLSGMSLKFYRPCGISRHTTDFLPPHISPEAQSLLKRLVVYNPSERIGPEEIKTHSFFRGIDWTALQK